MRCWVIERDALDGSTSLSEPTVPMIRRVYDWTLSLAGHPRALGVLAVVAFAEDSEGELFLISFYRERIYRIVAP